MDLLTSRDVERLRDLVGARDVGEGDRLLLDVLRPHLRQASGDMRVMAARRTYEAASSR